MDRNYFLQTLLTGGLMMGFKGRLLFPEGTPSREELIRIWQTSGELTQEFAEAMPAAEYLFRPADRGNIYTYGGQMQHIAENNVGLLSNYITDEPPPAIPVEKHDEKEVIKENIRKSFAYGIRAIEKLSTEEMTDVVDFFARPLPRWHVLFIAQDHTTHHCGQAVVYLNAKGIDPPSWRKW